MYFLGAVKGDTISEGQTTEVHIRDTLPRYLGIIEEVVVESGGVLGVSGKNRIDGCLTKDTTDMDIDWIMMVIPAIDYEDLRRMQGAAYSRIRDPVRRDKLNLALLLSMAG